MPPKKTTKKSNASKPRAARSKGEVRIRMYRQGLGDCFLVSFRKRGAKDFHLVIDCGVLNGSPDGSSRLRKAVENIKSETGGELDLLVATHEHADHLSGFNRAQDLWDTIQVKKTWLAWTENESDPAVKQLKTRQRVRLRAALAGLARMNGLAPSLTGEAQRKLSENASTIQGLLAFSLDEDDDLADLLNASAAEKKPSGPARALKWLKERAGNNLDYCHPKDLPRRLPGLDEVNVFVLGPPEGPLIRHSDPRQGEAYELFAGVLHADAYFGLAAGSDPKLFDGSADPAAAQPFEVFYQRSFDEVKSDPGGHAEGFFATHYGFDDDPDAWRRIDGDWLNLSEGLALALTGHINNTSLALAFELGEGGPVLLFPADAQAGSWLSWSDLTWQVPATSGGAARTVTGADLLKRAVFYKVGHHGSHNATMKDKGLELMTDPHLVAFIPVHQATAHRQVPEWKMPWVPLWNRLKERARGRVVLSDQDESMEKQLKPAPGVKADAARETEWAAFQQAIDWDKSPGVLWVEYRYQRS